MEKNQTCEDRIEKKHEKVKMSLYFVVSVQEKLIGN